MGVAIEEKMKRERRGRAMKKKTMGAKISAQKYTG